jgi:hypothetical protein
LHLTPSSRGRLAASRKPPLTSNVRAHTKPRPAFKMTSIWSRLCSRSLAVMAVMALPWVLSLGSHEALVLLAPGEVSARNWEWFSTLVFLVATVACVGLVFLGNLPRSAKIGVGLFLGLGGLYLAAMFHVHSNCGESSPYIGQKSIESSRPVGSLFRAVAFTTSSGVSRQRPNPSVKGTSRKRAAPYVER